MLQIWWLSARKTYPALVVTSAEQNKESGPRERRGLERKADEERMEKKNLNKGK